MLLVRNFLFLFLIGSSLGLNGQVCSDTLDIGSDTTLCTGQSVILDAGPYYLDYSWSTGDTGQSITVISSGTYWCQTHIVDSTSFVLNGDFSFGNFFFTSSYSYGSGGPWGLLSNEGEYAISTNASLTHNNFANCTDHTSGTGNFMIINGATSANTHVWCQTITIVPNTDYIFSAWFTSVVSSNPAILNFTINNITIGPLVNLSGVTCLWQNFYQIWNSGTNNSATICITNQNTAQGGNDFALDDIYFAQVCEFHDTVDVDVLDYPVVDLGPDIIMCQGDSTIFDATADSISTYLWHNGDTTTTYTAYQTEYVWVKVSNGICSEIDSVYVEVISYPVVNLGNDTFICNGMGVLLNAYNSGSTYLWSDGSTGNTLMANSSGTYWVIVSNGNCQASDSIEISISNGPIVNLGPDMSICLGDSVLLFAGNAAIILWSTGDIVPSIMVHPSAYSTYSVQLTDASGCAASDDINIDVIPVPDAFISKSADSICAGETVELLAWGGNVFLWDNGSTSPNIIVKPFISTTYHVTVSNILNGFECSDDTNSSINVLSCNYIYLPNAFTPNGDGVNDDIGPIGILEGHELYEFYIYDRWGGQVFFTTDFNHRWNGTINGNNAITGTYTYLILLKEAYKPKELRKGVFHLIR